MFSVKMPNKRTAFNVALSLCLCVLVFPYKQARAEVVKIDITQRDDWGTHDRIIGRVQFAVDPKVPANRIIADLDLAPRNRQGKVEFTSDLLLFVPKDPRRARGTVFLDSFSGLAVRGSPVAGSNLGCADRACPRRRAGKLYRRPRKAKFGLLPEILRAGPEP